jgi:hypothetical protein
VNPTEKMTIGMFMILLGLVMILFGLGAHCQTQPAATTTPKTFWVELGALTTANALDGYTTVRDTNRGWTEVGSPLVLGHQPGALRYSLVEGGAEALTAFGAYRMERSHRKVFRVLGHGLMIEGTGAHAYGAIANFRLKEPQ